VTVANHWIVTNPQVDGYNGTVSYFQAGLGAQYLDLRPHTLTMSQPRSRLSALGVAPATANVQDLKSTAWASRSMPGMDSVSADTEGQAWPS
jgi:hypothetical protein